MRIQRETKGRKGAGVTLILGLPLAEPELKSLLKQLKKQCGVGGTLREQTIELQGDHRQKVFQLLTQAPYQGLKWDVKIAGG